jgi:hypothetical protein
VCSTDGYCTIASFADTEIGKVFSGDLKTSKTENENRVISNRFANHPTLSQKFEMFKVVMFWGNRLSFFQRIKF